MDAERDGHGSNASSANSANSANSASSASSTRPFDEGAPPLDERALAHAIDEHERLVRPVLDHFWASYRNVVTPTGLTRRRGSSWTGSAWTGLGCSDASDPSNTGGVRARQALEAGLPARIRRTADANGVPREVVVENDIAWRIHAMVDFVFGKPPRILSTARDDATRRDVERLIDAAFEASGGISMLQDACLLAHVFGHVDFLVRVDMEGLRALATRRAELSAAAAGTDSARDDALLEAARLVRIEPIDPRRGVAILDGHDYRCIAAYAIVAHGGATAWGANSAGQSGGAFGGAQRLAVLARRLLGVDAGPAGASGAGGAGGAGASSAHGATHIEILTPRWAERRVDGRVSRVDDLAWAGGRVPIVHVQNIQQPFAYAGLSDVEPLLPLVDELNTRLSDRANRVTLQCFKMYLARGVDGFDKAPVGPGAVWSTDNPDASITAFGGDADSPSEAAHITEVREALDKISGVPPLASGVVRAKLGNLTSATALRITLMGLVARTTRKRVAYGRAIAEITGLILSALDAAGVMATARADRGVRVVWPDPIPVDLSEQVAVARAKSELGVPREDLLAELGHAGVDQGVE
jgi:hypothetical protein